MTKQILDLLNKEMPQLKELSIEAAIIKGQRSESVFVVVGLVLDRPVSDIVRIVDVSLGNGQFEKRLEMNYFNILKERLSKVF